MSKTTQARDTLYLDPAKFERLKRLAADTRIPRAELLREAVDDLLRKYRRTNSRRSRDGC